VESAFAIVGYSQLLREEGRRALRHAVCRANEQASRAQSGAACEGVTGQARMIMRLTKTGDDAPAFGTKPAASPVGGWAWDEHLIATRRPRLGSDCL
jgi:hypothetical protein